MSINRMGQCKLVDGLIKEGKTDDQIAKEVKERIPEYPEEKIRPLIKIRRAHMERKSNGQ